MSMSILVFRSLFVVQVVILVEMIEVVVQVEDRRDLDPPIRGLEARVAVVQIERQLEVVIVEELVRVAEELLLERIVRALEGGRRDRQLAVLEQRLRNAGNVQKGVLPIDWVVALQHVLMVRITLATQVVRIVVQWRMIQPIPVPLGQADAPQDAARVRHFQK